MVPAAGEDERVLTVSGCAEVPATQARTYLETTRAKRDGWLRLGDLPYQTEPHPPLSEGWWEQARQLLQWRVRLGSTHSLVSHAPEADLEHLYQAFVQPLRVTREPAAALEPIRAAPAAGCGLSQDHRP